MRASTWFWISTVTLLCAARLAHVSILWADEDYHLAAAVQILHGKALYRDLWYDKPPLGAFFALLWGGWPGLPLRLASTVVTALSCWAAFQFAARLWTPREGYAAAGSLAFYQVFSSPQATIAVVPDTLLIPLHLAVVYLAWRTRPFAAGLVCGLAFLLSPKAPFVLAACWLFHPAGWRALATGFVLPNALAAVWLFAGGALPDYFAQVWRWGLLYAAAPLDASPSAPLARLGGWVGFHAALWISAAIAWFRISDRGLRWRLVAWLALSLVAAAVGWRLISRYLNQVVPPLVILAAPGFVQLYALRRHSLRSVALAAIVALALMLPVIRFGPRYVDLASEALFAGGRHDWTDVRMDQESRRAAVIVRNAAAPGDTIFIWGYRPNVVAYTRLPVASPMWESQPLTGVPADRHLGNSVPLDAAWAARNREAVVRSSPAFIVDGLSRYNPTLNVRNYPELADWMRNYCLLGEDYGIVVYRRCH